jgi:thiol-disulfide isomerase/thioredoxin
LYLTTMKNSLLLIFLMAVISGANAQSTNNAISIVPDHGNISSLRTLLAKFHGKPLFVDMWASWCEPCKEEFKYGKALYAELKKRNIQLLYISIDKDTSDVAWRKDIEIFSLAGSHVKANKALRDELTTLIWGGIDAFSIPNYSLFDGNGNVVIKSALKPDTGTGLIKQLDNALAKTNKATTN